MISIRGACVYNEMDPDRTGSYPRAPADTVPDTRNWKAGGYITVRVGRNDSSNVAILLRKEFFFVRT